MTRRRSWGSSDMGGAPSGRFVLRLEGQARAGDGRSAQVVHRACAKLTPVVKLADLLAVPGLELAAVGVSEPDVDVRWVATSELVDPTPYLQGGEVLLTTGLETAALADEVAGVRRAPGPRRRRRAGTRGRAHPRPGAGRAGRGLSRCRAQPLRGPPADGLRRDLAGRRGVARRRARPGDATLARRPEVADQGGARARRRERPPRGARRAGGGSRGDGVRRRRADRAFPGRGGAGCRGGADRGRPDPGPGTACRGELVGRARDHARAAARCPLPAGAVARGVRAG